MNIEQIDMDVDRFSALSDMSKDMVRFVLSRFPQPEAEFLIEGLAEEISDMEPPSWQEAAIEGSELFFRFPFGSNKYEEYGSEDVVQSFYDMAEYFNEN